MNATTQSIIDRVTDVTKDVDHVRWTMAELSRWINDAQDQIAPLHPRAASQTVILTLGEGARQDLRTIDSAKRWIRLYELVCNVTSAGAPGATIRQVHRPALDTAFNKWRAATATAITVDEFAIDERDPFTFDVNPPVASGVKVQALVAVKPAPVAVLNADKTALQNPSELFGLSDGYDIPAVDYVLARCFGKDANDPSYKTLQQTHLTLFQLAMGIEVKDAAAS